MIISPELRYLSEEVGGLSDEVLRRISGFSQRSMKPDPVDATVQQNCYPELQLKGTERSNQYSRTACIGTTMDNGQRFAYRIRRIFTCCFSTKILLAVLIIAVSAATTVSSTSYQAEMGGAYQVSNSLTVLDKGIGNNKHRCDRNVPERQHHLYQTRQIANDAVTAGDLVYDVQVNMTASTPPLGCFTDTIVVNQRNSNNEKFDNRDQLNNNRRPDN